MIRNPSAMRRLAAGDSYTFLMKELEKVDDVILEPLTGTDWPRDMPVITGGGLLESIASIDVTYASSGGDDDNLFFEAANDIPVIQADISAGEASTAKSCCSRLSQAWSAPSGSSEPSGYRRGLPPGARWTSL